MASLQKRRCSRLLLIALGVGVASRIVSHLLPGVIADVLAVFLILFFLSVCVYVLWVELLQPLTSNGECPACRRRGMRRIARSTSFFECVYCRVRLKRSSPASEWQDASSVETDELYRANSQGGFWGGYAMPDPGKTTSGQLLISKRSRGLSTANQESDGSGSVDEIDDESVQSRDA